MEGKRFIHSLRLQNFLSYGSEGEEIELQPLNVLIGPNASSKGEYHKIQHGAKLLEMLNVERVRKASSHCDRLFTTLSEIIESK